MPPTWNTEDSWPIDWLLQCVSWLQQGDSWLACGHSLSDGTPLQDDTLMTSMLLTIPEERDKGAENCQLPNGDSVAIYQLVMYIQKKFCSNKPMASFLYWTR
ncbi:suppressor of fused domain protein [Bacteroides stercoris]|nr:suppressor of fused domain protein [Bacteroides stercoris]